MTKAELGYYYRMFAGIPQSQISRLLERLWRRDPFQAKWSILAKAFSVIRDDKGKKDASLDAYLTISAPFVAIVRPADYLGLMGYQLTVVNNQATMIQRQNFDINAINPGLLTTPHSVNDVVENCYRQGYITENRTDAGPSNSHGAMIMATNANPVPMTVHLNPVPVPVQSNPVPLPVHSNLVPMPAHSNSVPTPVHSQAEQSSSGESGPKSQHEQNAIQDEEDEEVKENTGGDEQQSAQPATQSSLFGIGVTTTAAEGSETNVTNDPFPNLTMDLIDQSFGEFPFNGAFNPDLREGYVFDPFAGNGFDAVDMGDVEQFDINDWVFQESEFLDPAMDDAMFPGAPFS